MYPWLLARRHATFFVRIRLRRFLTPTLRDDCPGFQFGTCYNNQGHRGVAQRNLALRFLREKLYLYCDREHVNATLSSESSEYGHVDRYLGEVGTADAFGGGCAVEKIPKLLRTEPVVYFADDDNLYDVDLFRELTKVKRFGIVSVGFPWKAPRYVSAPVVGSSGQITAFDTFYCFDRAYVGFLPLRHLFRALFVAHIYDEQTRAQKFDERPPSLGSRYSLSHPSGPTGTRLIWRISPLAPNSSTRRALSLSSGSIGRPSGCSRT